MTTPGAEPSPDRSGRGLRAAAGWAIGSLALALILMGVLGASVLLRQGAQVTGLDQARLWGWLIASFLFFLGAAHGAALVAAALRASGAKDLPGVARALVGVALLAALAAPMNLLLDVGRPADLGRIVSSATPASPLFWDFLVTVLFVGTAGMALLLPEAKAGPAVAGLAILALIGEGIVVWIFAMAGVEPWGGALPAIRLLAGSLYGGLALLGPALVMLSAASARAVRVGEDGFRRAGSLLALAAAAWWLVALPSWLPGRPDPPPPPVWLLCGVVPPALLAAGRRSRPLALALAGGAAAAGLWIERGFVICHGLGRSRMSYSPAACSPSWVEWSIPVAELACILLALRLGAGFLPAGRSSLRTGGL